MVLAKGSSFRSSFRSSSSVSRSVSKPSAPKVATKPTTSTKTTTVKTPPKPGYKTTGAVVGTGGYAPKFSGYTAPTGSTVYYHNTSSWDWIPLMYIMNASSHQQATVVQPDGKKVEVKQEGVDGMLIFNWVIMILLGLGLIALIVWLVNKYTSKGGLAHGAA